MRKWLPKTVIGWLGVGALFFWIWTFIGAAWPESYWFDVRSVEVESPAHEGWGREIAISVDRTIVREFDGEYSVVVRAAHTLEVVCDGSATIRYNPEASLPYPVTLAWWVGDDCFFPAGDYVMHSTWDVQGSIFEAFHKDIEITTEFTLLPAPEKVDSIYGAQIEQQSSVIEELKDLIESQSIEIDRLSSDLEALK